MLNFEGVLLKFSIGTDREVRAFFNENFSLNFQVFNFRLGNPRHNCTENYGVFCLIHKFNGRHTLNEDSHLKLLICVKCHSYPQSNSRDKRHFLILTFSRLS